MHHKPVIMAFFGLTALGPHPFTSLESNHRTLHLFTENDVGLAWKKSGGEESLPIESLGKLLKELHCGPAPVCEINRLNGLIQGNVKHERISWSALRKAFLTIQEQALIDEANKVAPSDRQLFTSNHDYRDAVRRHSSSESKASISTSLTTNQSYGWKRGNDMCDLGIPHKIRGKKSCPETLYCNELIKSGLTY